MDESILTFWFGENPDELTREQMLRWFRSDPAFDQAIAQRFGKLYKAAVNGAFRDWCERPRGRLALLIMLDQFSRNLHRESPLAWSQDAKCLDIARLGLEEEHDRVLRPVERVFFYMPFQHSEDVRDQAASVRLYQDLYSDYPDLTFVERSLKSAEYHHQLVTQFGRFPHRNHILGRETTEPEREYLASLPPGKRF